MARDDDDQVLREKRTIDIVCVAAASFSYDEEEETSGEVATVEDKEKQRQRTRRLINYALRSTMSFGSSKRQKIDESQNPQQNPNRDASSPRLCPVESKRRLHVAVSNKVVRRKNPVRRREEPVREREPVRDRVTPEWLVNVMKEENGEDAKLIILKKLEFADIAKGQARLLIPWNQIEDTNFLNEEELNIIDEHKKKIRKKGVDVTLVDSRGKHWALNFRRWDMKTTSNYALCTGWNKVVAENNLTKNQKLWLWSFHSPGKLFLAFVPPADPAPVLALTPVPDPAPVVTSDSGQSSSAM